MVEVVKGGIIQALWQLRFLSLKEFSKSSRLEADASKCEVVTGFNTLKSILGL